MLGAGQRNTPGSSWLEDRGELPTFGSAVGKAHARFTMTLDQKGPVNKKRRQTLCSNVISNLPWSPCGCSSPYLYLHFPLHGKQGAEELLTDNC